MEPVRSILPSNAARPSPDDSPSEIQEGPQRVGSDGSDTEHPSIHAENVSLADNAPPFGGAYFRRPSDKRGASEQTTDLEDESETSRPAGTVAKTVTPGSFNPELHYYPTVLSAELHPTVERFMALDQQQLASRYLRLHPRVDSEALITILGYRPSFLRWAGCDLFHALGEDGRQLMVLIETNSSPSGQKSMPHPGIAAPSEQLLQGGYWRLARETILPAIPREGGELAVIYDKNEMEASGYAAALADAAGAPVHLVPFYENDPDPGVRVVRGGALEVRTEYQGWVPIRAALRYVTQRPWNRLPALSSSKILNPVLACISGGRNKALAALAYEKMNDELKGTGLRINTPETMVNVRREELSDAVEYFGGQAVIKVPYGNAGQDVFTVVSKDELDHVLERPFRYERFLVQSLVGDPRWLHKLDGKSLFHIGSAPVRGLPSYAIDLRMMVIDTPHGLSPVAMYGRKAHYPLPSSLPLDGRSWEYLGTNLSVKKTDGAWSTETDRLLPCDKRNFDTIGVGLDQLVEGYIQTVLAMVAIDRVARSLVSSMGTLRTEKLGAIIEDQVLLDEIRLGMPPA